MPSKFYSMKNTFFVLLTFVCVQFLSAQVINIPDANFKAKLLSSTSNNYIASNGTQQIKIDSNNNGEIEVSEAQQVVYLNLDTSMSSPNSIKIIDLIGIEYFTNLVNLSCEYNKIAILNLGNFPNLNAIYFGNNLITSINLNNLPQLHSIECDENLLTNLDLSSVPSLEHVSFDNNQLVSVNCIGLVNAKELWFNYNQLTSLDISGMTALERVFVNSNLLTNFTFTSHPNLTTIGFNTNQLTQLDLSSFSNLIDLTCAFNQLTSLNLGGINLQYLECSVNQLTSLDLSSCTSLAYLYCIQNQLTSLDLTGLNGLISLECQYNQISSLDLQGKHLITNFYCRNNQLTTLDLRDLWALDQFSCVYNNLESLFMKNGVTQQSFNFNFNPNIKFVCADESEIFYVQENINYYGYASTCTVNSYCSFTPGGKVYTIEGNEKLDVDNNGCDTSDMTFPNLKFAVSGNSSTSEIIANETGNFSIPVSDGSYTITPIIENPSYFTIAPTSVSANFPEQSTPFATNFCVSPNGLHQDVEITLLPISEARPGFDAVYKLVFKNKGNITVSGTINLVFQDALLDFVSANPMTTSQNANSLVWTYSDLLPFETRAIELVLNVNSPMETPSVNNGDQLSFAAVINPLTGDEIPIDNTSALKQIVVGSLDPNDKTCVEGNVVGTNMIGQYVHYLIRFENTGTYAAENIVVKDLINTTKFDIATLVPVDSSHSFVTRITNTNQVEFIFENINLPFDDANNDGYIAFKIKTKSNLTVGSSFSNTASIYFDYNFPVVTNTATTTIQALGNSDFEFNDYFTLSPVPTKDVLHFETNQSIAVSSISIYNTLGQLILVETNPSNQIDVSNLKTGNYFIKVTSDKGASVGKFIKQ